MLRLTSVNKLHTSTNSVCSKAASQVSNVSKDLRSIIETTNIPTKDVPNPVISSKKTSNQSFQNRTLFKVVDEKKPRFNDFNIQMIPQTMCDHLFGKKQNISQINLIELNKAITELKKHGLMSICQEVLNIKINLPALEGGTIDDHFYNIGEAQCAPYRKLVSSMLTKLPLMPQKWDFIEGWTKYSDEGSCRVDFPEEDALVFDVEVCCSQGQMPTIATAVSTKAWYSWTSSDLVHGSKKKSNNHYTLDCLIPLESNTSQKGFSLSENFKIPRIVVGHNVSYDRARIKEQYWLEKTALRFLDTMSLHICISGVTSYQKNLLKAGLGQEDEWSKLSSLNSLSKVHQLYCGSEVSKSERNIFVSGTLKDVMHNFQSLMTYCANDVIYTHNVLCKLFPMYISRFPHPVSLAGMLELGLAYLPVNSNWDTYIRDSNDTYDDLDTEAKMILTQLADNSCQFLHNNEYRKHLWLWDEDWKTKDLALKKSKSPSRNDKILSEVSNQCLPTVGEEILGSIEEIEYERLSNKFKHLMSKGNLLPVRIPLLPGYPLWYTKMCSKPSSPDWIAGPRSVSTGMQIAPKLLSLQWKSMPLHYVQGHGWGMLVPFKTDIELDNVENVPLKQLIQHCHNVKSDLFCKCQKLEYENSSFTYICNKKELKAKNTGDENGEIFCKVDIGSGCGLIKLPHKDGKKLNVGNPLARDYIYKFSEHGVGSGNPKTEKLIEISRMLSYWRNNRERVENQISIWLGPKDIPKFVKDKRDLGVILPQVIVCGTLTRRAVEPTWMTASNALGDRIGSELRAMINAPSSYCFVGADVDSQELWIAAIIGDAYSTKHHGSTPFGWMTLSGQKSDGTDMHSVTAKAVGISRNNAKVLNYARIYGAGQQFAEHLLRQFNPEMSSSEAKQKASKMFTMTKGKRVYVLKKGMFPDTKQRNYTKYGAKELCLLYSKSVDELFEKPKWMGGTESAMFNQLEEIASSPEPQTPFLKGRLSRALEPSLDTNDKFIPTRVNWVVQSGAVDFLHLMLVCMRWLIGPEIRFCLSFHDEVRYLVPKGLRYQVALALHITNLYTRAYCISQLGMKDVPRSIAFFSSVEVDTCLRKESDQDCKTPSNPFGLSKGYGIPPGESLDIEKAMSLSRGIIGQPAFRKKKKKISNASNASTTTTTVENL